MLHNIAIAEYSRDGYPDPKKLLEVLNNIEVCYFCYVFVILAGGRQCY